MMYLVDTNVISEARRGTPQAIDWLRSVDPEHIYVSVITLGEIMLGIALMQRRDPVQASRVQNWLTSLNATYADRILPVTINVALSWGAIASLRPRGDADGLIAATATLHGMTLVTRNTADFDDLPISLINPWLINP